MQKSAQLCLDIKSSSLDMTQKTILSCCELVLKCSLAFSHITSEGFSEQVNLEHSSLQKFKLISGFWFDSSPV